MNDQFERARKWFLNQSTPVQAGVVLGIGIIIILIILVQGFVQRDQFPRIK